MFYHNEQNAGKKREEGNPGAFAITAGARTYGSCSERIGVKGRSRSPRSKGKRREKHKREKARWS